MLYRLGRSSLAPDVSSRLTRDSGRCRTCRVRRVSATLVASKSPPLKRRRSARAPPKISKRKGDSVDVFGYPDGALLFQFGSTVHTAPGSTLLGTLSPGQQWQSEHKLSRLSNGQTASLSFQLWQHWPSNDTAVSSQQNGEALDASQEEVLASTSSNGNGTASQFHTNAEEHTMQAASSNGSSAQSSGQWYAPDAAAQQSRDLADQMASRRASGHEASLSAPSNGSTPPPEQLLARPIQTAPSPAMSDQPKQPSAVTAAPTVQNGAASGPAPFPWPSRLGKHAQRVPCYMWHESRPPTSITLTQSQPNMQSTGGSASSEEYDSDTDTDEPAVSAGSNAMDCEFFPSRTQLRSMPSEGSHHGPFSFLQPIIACIVRLWCCLPYWFRRIWQPKQKQRIPAVHASPLLSQHIRTYRRAPVPGSSFDPGTGRSPAPLADLQRHQVEDLIGCGVRNMDLYRAALSSKSAVEPEHIIARSFDRLEFLGDAVVGQVFKDYIFQRFPKDSDGAMTHTFSTLASNRAHELYARHLHLARYIASNLQFMRPSLRVSPEVQADAFEALVGAIYLDRGLRVATRFLTRIAEDVMGVGTALSSYRNYKLYLITNVNQADMGRITYVTKQNKSNKLWLSKCLLQGKLVGVGLDKSPKQAEAAAAYAAMKHLNIRETSVATYLRRPVTIE